MLTHQVGTAAEQEADAARLARVGGFGAPLEGMGMPLDAAGGLDVSMESMALSPSARYVGSHQQPREAVLLATDCLLRDVAAAREVAIPLGAVVAPCLQLLDASGVRAPLQCIRRAAARCDGCGAFLNQYCEAKQSLNRVEWTCVFCRKTNEAKQVESTLSPELQTNTVEYRSPHEQPLESPAGPPEHVVCLLVDLSCGAEELRAMTAAIGSVLDQLDESWRLCLVSFSNVVMVHELARHGVAAAQVIPGTTGPSDDNLSRITGKLRNRFCPRASRDGVVAALAALASLRCHAENEAGPRCTGPAITAAMAAMGAMETSGPKLTGHMLLLSCGAPNLGPGAVPSAAFGETVTEAQSESAALYFNSAAKELAGHRIVVDLVAIGNEELGLSELISLPQLTGGTSILHLTAVAQTTVPDEDEDDDEEETEEEKLSNGLSANLQKLLEDDTNWTYDASLDVRLSPSLRVERMVGVAEAPFSSVTAAAQPVTDNFCRLTTLHPQRSVTVFLEHDNAVRVAEDRYAYVQFIVYHTEARGGGMPHEVVGRVCTRRMELTTSVADYVASADAKTVTVMVAKLNVLRAMKLTDETMEETHAALDRAVGSIAKGCAPVTGMAVVPPPSGLGALFSYIVPASAGQTRASCALTNQVAQFPPTLERLPFWCFMLRRGPLLGPILQHPDDIVALRQSFLSCSFAAAMGVISPQLYFAAAPPHDFTAVECYETSMQSDKVRRALQRPPIWLRL